jgi:hypothetical protein
LNSENQLSIQNSTRQNSLPNAILESSREALAHSEISIAKQKGSTSSNLYLGSLKTGAENVSKNDLKTDEKEAGVYIVQDMDKLESKPCEAASEIADEKSAVDKMSKDVSSTEVCVDDMGQAEPSIGIIATEENAISSIVNMNLECCKTVHEKDLAIPNNSDHESLVQSKEITLLKNESEFLSKDAETLESLVEPVKLLDTAKLKEAEKDSIELLNTVASTESIVSLSQKETLSSDEFMAEIVQLTLHIGENISLDADIKGESFKIELGPEPESRNEEITDVKTSTAMEETKKVEEEKSFDVGFEWGKLPTASCLFDLESEVAQTLEAMKNL